MLSCLRPFTLSAFHISHYFIQVLHLTVRSRHHNNGTIHVRCTSNHVLNVISVARAVYMGIMAVFCLVLDVRRRDGDTALSFFRRLVNGAII